MSAVKTTTPLEILFAAENVRIAALSSAAKLFASNTPAFHWLSRVIDLERQLDRKQCPELLRQVAKVVGDYQTQKSVTHRPFEIFWGTPDEPQHTQLLAYFFDPKEDHGWGTDLLRALFDTLGLKHLLIDNETEVKSEHPTTAAEGGGFIDILITRDAPDCRYAIVIENKVNHAPDTGKQLQKYVSHLRGGPTPYIPNELYVFYLPLQRGREPSDDSKGNIERVSTYRAISFEVEIVQWLKMSLKTIRDVVQTRGASADQAEGMLDNLKHYLNLVRHLVRQEKEQEMKQKILQQLREADNRGELPEWTSIESLVKHANTLAECVKRLTREQLFLAIEKQLGRRNLTAVFAGMSAGIDTAINSPLKDNDDCYLSVLISVDPLVSVCLCMNVEGTDVAIGYRRVGKQKDAQFEEFSKKNDPNIFKGGVNGWWYSWNSGKEQWNRVLGNRTTCEEVATWFADKMAELHTQILPAVKAYRKSQNAKPQR